MVLIVLHLLCGILSLVGLTTVICGVSRRLADVADGGRYLLVILKGEDADLHLKAAVEGVGNGQLSVDGGVVAVDAGLDENARRACRLIADESGCVALYTVSEFQNWLGGVADEPNV